MQARRYAAEFGRFLSVDPMADEFAGWSPYSYAFNNPLIYSDPTGMAPVCEQEENCDDTYEVGAIVENRLGSWQYLGDNQWETLSLAEGVDQIQSGLGHAMHRLGSTFSTDYHDFGSRTLAEETMMNVSNRAPSLEILGGMRALAFRGVGYLSSLFKTRSTASLGTGLNESIGGIVRPGGKLVGTQSASNPAIRTVSKSEAQIIINRLIESGAKISIKPGYPGVWYKLPGGGGFGIRNVVSGQSTRLGSKGAIDMNIPGIPIKNIKF